MVEGVPANTPENGNVYITGNFNYWDPGDDKFQLGKKGDSAYVICMDMFLGNLEYKFTRGDWSSEETNKCGNSIDAHSLEFGFGYWFGKKKLPDTLYHTIASWKDKEPLNCDSITIVINKKPGSTGENDTLQITGNINAWNPTGENAYVFKEDTHTGQLYTRVPLTGLRMRGREFLEFKVAKGKGLIQEADEFGRELEKRKIRLGAQDSLFIDIDNWEGEIEERLNVVTIILNSIPENTPKYANVFLVGNFNNWFPGDKDYQFYKNEEGKYQIDIPRGKYGLSFKITRGSWETEASDACGNKWGNQSYDYSEIDTLFYTIEGWKDIPVKKRRYFTFVIDELPENTPGNPEFYVISNYTYWDHNFLNNQFVKKNGKWVCTMKAKSQDLEFKVTRGTWAMQETDSRGLPIPNRYASPCQDTIFLKIKGWLDVVLPGEPFTTLEVYSYPKVPEGQKVYIAGPFNDWVPGNPDMCLEEKANGKFYIDIPDRWFPLTFKFARGDWKTVETKSDGGFLPNRVEESPGDTIRLFIKGWEDMKR
jgi:hypothetical protein